MNRFKPLVIRSMQFFCAVILAGVLPTAWASDAGQIAADQVSEDSYRDFLDLYLYTHIGDNRGFGPEHDLAQANIADLFESYGLIVTLEPVPYGPDTYYNVVGTKLGTLYPDQEYVVGAHYDSVDNPGADDDASGVALVLEAARILTQYDSDYTIRFVAFDREEQGLHGSYEYVETHSSDNILAMIQADMIAHDPGTDHARLFGGGAATVLKNELLDAVAMYGDGLTAADYGYSGGSDHVPFDQVGIPACLVIESVFNPYYHSPQDNFENPDNLNFAYASRITRSVVGYLVDHAGVAVPVDTLEFIYPDGLPQWIDPAGGTRVSVEVVGVGEAVPQPGTAMLHYSYGIGWLTEPMEIVTGNLYEAVFPGASCEQTLLYYFSAEDTDGLTYVDPWNAPAAFHSALAVYGEVVYMSDDFETDQNWTVDGNALAGQWERGTPVGGGDRGDPPTDHDGSGQCYLTDNTDGDSDVDGGYTYLTSPPIDLSGGDAIVSYALWYTNNAGADPNNDLFNTYVSNDDGVNWELVETVGPQTTAGWVEHAFWVGDHVTPTTTVRVMFEASDLGGGSVVEAGIDDFTVFVYNCEPDLAADLNADGTVDAADLAILLGSWGPCPGDGDCPADFNGDGLVDAADLAVLLGNWG